MYRLPGLWLLFEYARVFRSSCTFNRDFALGFTLEPPRLVGVTS